MKAFEEHMVSVIDEAVKTLQQGNSDYQLDKWDKRLLEQTCEILEKARWNISQRSGDVRRRVVDAIATYICVIAEDYALYPHEVNAMAFAQKIHATSGEYSRGQNLAVMRFGEKGEKPNVNKTT